MVVLLVVALACLSGCSEDANDLSGSLGDYYDLSFDSVRARLYSSELAIEYVASNGQVPVRVAIHRGQQPLSSTTYDLDDSGDITGQRGASRIPRFIDGKVTLTRFGDTDRASIEGHFSATFQTGRDESTITGMFSTALEVVDAPRGYEVDTRPDAPDPGR